MVRAQGTAATLIVAALFASACGGRTELDAMLNETEKPGSPVSSDDEAGVTVDASTNTGTSAEAPFSNTAASTGGSSGGGVLAAPCDAGLTLCGGTCVNLSTNAGHCGLCITGAPPISAARGRGASACQQD